jgi:hypothetical protein
MMMPMMTRPPERSPLDGGIARYGEKESPRTGGLEGLEKYPNLRTSFQKTTLKKFKASFETLNRNRCKKPGPKIRLASFLNPRYASKRSILG